MYYKYRSISRIVLLCIAIICVFPQIGKCEPIINKVVYPLYHELFDALNDKKYEQKYEVGPLIESGKLDGSFAFTIKIYDYETIILIKTDNNKPRVIYVNGTAGNDNHLEYLSQICCIFALMCDLNTDEMKQAVVAEKDKDGYAKIWSNGRQKYLKVGVRKIVYMQEDYIQLELALDE